MSNPTEPDSREVWKDGRCLKHDCALSYDHQRQTDYCTHCFTESITADAEPDSREVYDVEKGFSTGLSAEPDNTVDNEELKDVFDALWESYVEDDLEGLAPSGIRLRKELIAYAKALNEGGMPLTALEQENESQQHVFDHTVRRLNRELEQAWQKEGEALQRAERAEKASEDWEGTAREQAGTIETLHKKLREPGEAWSKNPRTPTSEDTDDE